MGYTVNSNGMCPICNSRYLVPLALKEIHEALVEVAQGDSKDVLKNMREAGADKTVTCPHCYRTVELEIYLTIDIEARAPDLTQ